MDRIIEIKVGGNYITKDSKNAGVRGEGNVTVMRITFNEGWDNYTKKVTFWDARGLNPVEITLTENLLENIKDSTRVYLVPIPPEPMAEAGMFTFVIDGYIDGKMQRTIADKLEVKDSPIAENAGNATAPTPDVYMQLQSNITKLDTDIQKAVKATEKAIEATDEIKNMSVTSEMLESDEDAFVEKTEQDGALNLHFGIPEGKQGETGDSGVYIGETPPTDENINVWISKGNIPETGTTWYDWNYCLKIKDEAGIWIDIPAIKGSSAYEIAVQYGYKGTEEEWNNAVNEARIAAETSAERARQSETQALQSRQNASASETVCVEQAEVATSAANESKASADSAKQSATQAQESKERIEELVQDGKVYSDNNFSDAYKTKLDGIDDEANNAIVYIDSKEGFYQGSKPYFKFNRGGRVENGFTFVNALTDEDCKKLDNLGAELPLVWETTLGTATTQVKPDNNNNLNLVRGKLVITFPEVETIASGRPIIYFAPQAGLSLGKSKPASCFIVNAANTVGASPIYVLEFDMFSENIVATRSRTMAVGSDIMSYDASSGVILTQLDGEERVAVNTIYAYFQGIFPIGTKFELWGC